MESESLGMVGVFLYELLRWVDGGEVYFSVVCRALFVWISFITICVVFSNWVFIIFFFEIPSVGI